MIISMGFSCGDGLDGKESKIPSSGKVEETSHSGKGSHSIELDVEFEPIDHPLEPFDEDRPVKCPMPNSSVLNEGGTRRERSAESLKKRAELSATIGEGKAVVPARPPVQAVRKRHHALSRNQSVPLSFRAPQTNILRILREYKGFEC
ncbi:uncharacterized protein LOC143881665 isoform X2 [Tasmannia lanceolata]|uniref:uncharacterized protein LOC143881665 isoform X2 n=1 Tax=Tasmannia lanceolata TaxID=3420 RepID=UPI004062E517